MLQYVNELEKSVQDFVDVICDTYEYPRLHAALGTDFMYRDDAAEVRFAAVVANSFSESFMARVNRLYPDIAAPEFLWSLLHEIGHAMTGDELDADELEESWKGKTTVGLTAEEYYELPDEFWATDWAARCMRENGDMIGSYWIIVQEELMNFYKKNGVM